MICKACGAQNQDDVRFCAHCGAQMNGDDTGQQQPDQVQPAASATRVTVDQAAAPTCYGQATQQGQYQNYPQGPQTTINVQTSAAATTNSLGTAGFVLSLIALFLSWIPVIGWVLWLLGAVLSVIGIFKIPRGLAIAGTVISFIDIIFLLMIIGSCTAMSGLVR
ncbi:hypothetical protein Corgl_0295 [Coriobacterium glomerans PW2]|uniref:Zinc-ribbon domain-containing protein n=1 Tax=Coriobacterium glomerans (strain ATCC 49209 / DSM 20642 / JCM 10262 / PW2) TaxID=700015 RepID=F2NA23_CORGP|nr:zinc ribbon domain-containing protein [Coriobacterium glomerans]AEB06417.1 hypothetical protein Corgl_0295 [Coriobacterium glomerans PW2]